MIVEFSHQLKIGESRVVEALGLISSLCSPEAHLEVIDLSSFDDLYERYSDFFNIKLSSTGPNFSALEFALLSYERDDITRFIDEVNLYELVDQVHILLGQEYTKDEVKEMLDFSGDFNQLTKAYDFDSSSKPLFDDPSVYFSTLFELLKEIDQHPAFNAKINELAVLDEVVSLKKQFKEGMLVRHPLSYAQELMGKPFWNIADYTYYDFIPTYYSSPYSMRLMDGKTMIYLHALKRMKKDESTTVNELIDQLKSISDNSRLKILKMLYMKPMYGKEIAEALGLTTATVSHHLDALHQQGLINMEKVKQIKYFSTNYTRLSRQLDQIEKYIKNQ